MEKYPETYAIYSKHRGDKTFPKGQQKQIRDVVSTWEAALQTQGDQVQKVEMYEEHGGLTFTAFSKVDPPTDQADRN